MSRGPACKKLQGPHHDLIMLLPAFSNKATRHGIATKANSSPLADGEATLAKAHRQLMLHAAGRVALAHKPGSQTKVFH